MLRTQHAVNYATIRMLYNMLCATAPLLAECETLTHTHTNTFVKQCFVRNDKNMLFAEQLMHIHTHTHIHIKCVCFVAFV